MSEEPAPRTGRLEGPIERIRVSGFKSLADPCEVEIKPLTLLAGANSSGKSSVMQALLLLKQTLESPHDPGPLLLNGPHVSFSRVAQLRSHHGGVPAAEELAIAIGMVSGWGAETAFTYDSSGFELDRTSYWCIDQWCILRSDASEMTQEAWQVFECICPGMSFDTSGRLASFLVGRRRCFVEPQLAPPLQFLSSLWGPSWRALLQTLHVVGYRAAPQRTYPVAGLGEQFTGPFDPYVASLIRHWQEDGHPNLDRLNHAMQHLGLASQVEATPVDDTSFALRAQPALPGGEAPTVDVADMGSGVRQVLPALAALVVADAGQLVYLEQPEIHLHPRAQAALAEVLAEAANSGVRVVVETHSDLLLTTVMALVAEGKLGPDKVALHWFSRDALGRTRVTTAEPDEAGRYGDWPQDFADVKLATEGRYLDAVEERLFGAADAEG